MVIYGALKDTLTRINIETFVTSLALYSFNIFEINIIMRHTILFRAMKNELFRFDKKNVLA